jgi:hypothetical protein
LIYNILGIQIYANRGYKLMGDIKKQIMMV